jgi:hypothetical protein
MGNCYFKLPQGPSNRIYGNLKKLGQLNQAGVPAVATFAWAKVKDPSADIHSASSS